MSDTKTAPRAPIRSFEGTARPHEPFWRFINADESESQQVELEFYGFISEFSWFGDEITPAMFKKELDKVGNGAPILVKMDSPGGDVFAAGAIRSMLLDYPGEVTVRIDGIAASAAVMVTMGADRVQIQDHAYMMVHDPGFAVMGFLQIEFLELLITALGSIKEGILDVYEKRTGLAADELSRMMVDETWMSARQAVNFHFADEVISGGAKEAKIENAAFVNCIKNYAHVPPAIMRAYKSITPQAAAAPAADEQAVKDLQERVHLILEGAEK